MSDGVINLLKYEITIANHNTFYRHKKIVRDFVSESDYFFWCSEGLFLLVSAFALFKTFDN
ncbi:hypothetical protein BADSM9389_01290 [Buttiauxella agrestis]|nr:hypothetical protein BADSM9389_01290 [Buttiauxella agrestis]